MGITARSPVLKGSRQFCCAVDQFCSQCSLLATLLVANVLLDIANVTIISPEQPLFAQLPALMEHLNPPILYCENIAFYTNYHRTTKQLRHRLMTVVKRRVHTHSRCKLSVTTSVTFTLTNLTFRGKCITLTTH